MLCQVMPIEAFAILMIFIMCSLYSILIIDLMKDPQSKSLKCGFMISTLAMSIAILEFVNLCVFELHAQESLVSQYCIMSVEDCNTHETWYELANRTILTRPVEHSIFTAWKANSPLYVRLSYRQALIDWLVCTEGITVDEGFRHLKPEGYLVHLSKPQQQLRTQLSIGNGETLP